MSNDTQPEIRFPGFTEDWEERKLKDIFDIHTDFVSNGSFQALKDNVKLYKTENYAYMIRLQDASNNWSGPWLYTDKQGFDFLSKSTVYKDDILMSDRGTIGKFFLVPQLDKPMTLSSNAVLLRSTKNDNNFIYYMLNTSNISNQIIVRTTPGVQPMISKTEFKKINTRIPNIQEQQKIGSFFKQLDNTIALHQRKLDLLKETKKGFLQKMFPKNGAKVPEIRFPGFTGDWEQRKLGDITESFSGGTPTAGKSEYYGGDIPFIRSGEISSELTELFITENGLNNSSAKMVKAGDILYALYGATSGEVSISRINGAINQAILAIRPTKNDNSYLIVQWLRKQKDTIISTYLQGGQGNLSGSIVKDLVITLPQDKEEQNKIGTFFKQLDDTIALHQRKLDLLKETKKGFLQKMFV
ncbi:restriction endonuclease subunit S [Enterococcus faecium]|uniref:restriction endonuclease subunit S n=1 Tax=Enterococcus TaxID=1350 RepID=UPI0011F12C0A|nr:MULTISPECIES: restriction endonuclease subunit S [Enterococcus]MBY3608640.1 restriction endonuclease subunit S [Enterococcus faecium]QEN53436.1 restriction endonuclease subunit S [Enterococcus faecium]